MFAIVFAIYQFGLGSSRAFLGEPALIRISKVSPELAKPSNLLGASLLLGVLGLALSGAASLLPGSMGSLFLVLAVAFPVLMAVDSCRYWLFATNRPRQAALIDAVWLTSQLAAYAVAILVGASAPPVVLGTWAFGALVALALFCAVHRTLPSVRGGWSWILRTRDLAGRFFGEYLAISGTQQSVIYFSVIFSGLSASAALRGGQVLVGPLSMVSMGVAVVALPALSRVAHEPRHLMRRAVTISGALLTATCGYGVLLLLVPPGVAEGLLGESWSSGIALIPLLLIQIAVSNIAYGATASLRAMEAARISFRLRLATLPVTLGAIFVGAISSPQGAVLGAVIGGSIQALCWWMTVILLNRRRKTGAE
ncbi:MULTISPECIES: hypothetical protein [Microbacterium]|uniref:Lipopolysaccharide biosynthesis protein n=1 Tax=Microbacterium wangchenii TaxID=2541726 RepID=A0ABX5SR68_9MICO|nr:MULTISPECIES: hypothetical protein [Microbacterium]MCK6068101.1 hypothetical protein [Microbacterium sp. EYE_512]QBR87777.1 hypothetical protein E4K62_03105 [Microbacterium wangchenii]